MQRATRDRNTRKWQMGLKSDFKGLIVAFVIVHNCTFVVKCTK
jgi:hypothetical protein